MGDSDNDQHAFDVRREQEFKEYKHLVVHRNWTGDEAVQAIEQSQMGALLALRFLCLPPGLSLFQENRARPPNYRLMVCQPLNVDASAAQLEKRGSQYYRKQVIVEFIAMRHWMNYQHIDATLVPPDDIHGSIVLQDLWLGVRKGYIWFLPENTALPMDMPYDPNILEDAEVFEMSSSDEN